MSRHVATGLESISGPGAERLVFTAMLVVATIVGAWIGVAAPDVSPVAAPATQQLALDARDFR